MNKATAVLSYLQCEYCWWTKAIHIFVTIWVTVNSGIKFVFFDIPTQSFLCNFYAVIWKTLLANESHADGLLIRCLFTVQSIEWYGGN